MTTQVEGPKGPDKRAMLAQLLAQKAAGASKPQPVAPGQERLWFLEQLTPGTAVYSVPAAIWLKGPLDLGALERSLTEIVRRHAALRTTFAEGEGGLPVQTVGQPGPQPVPVTDLTHLPLQAAREEARRGANEAACQPFDLATGPLFRAQLYRVAPEEHLLVMVLHHIICDLWSIGVMLQELEQLYPAFAAGQPSLLPPLTRSYLAYAKEQRELADSPSMAEHLAYWKGKLGGRLPMLQLPTDRSRPALATYAGAVVEAEMASDLAEGVAALARREGATPYMVLLAAFKALLYRYTRETDLTVGTPVANRNQAEDEALVGLFVNTLVLRTDLSGEPTFVELLARVRETCLGAYAHQEMDFARLMEVLQPDRSLGTSPLFQVMFSMANAAASLQLPGLSVTWEELHTRTAKYDLLLVAGDSESENGGISLRLEYNSDLFSRATVTRMLGHFAHLLSSALTDPQAKIDELPLMPDTEQAVLATWNRTGADYPRTATLHGLVATQTAATPDRVAAVFDGRALTYAELNRRANQVAHALRELGVGPDVLVGLCMERSEAMLVGLLGILKAGGAYVPLDPTYPTDRLSYMLEDAEAPVLLTCGRTPVAFGGQVLDLERDATAIAPQPVTDPVDDAGPENLAYVIYTSGSTGRPKGVAVRHGGVVNFLTSMRAQPGLAMGDTLLAVTSISFDIHVLELYLPLTTGAKVVLASRADALDGHRLADLMRQHGVTIMQATPATWRLLLESGWQAPAGMRLLTGGEALSRELADRLLAAGAELWNMYGPTETTVWSTVWPVAADGPILIGRPIANTQLYVLDAKLAMLPAGVAGDLYIGGDGLAREYLKRPDLTADRFVQTPYGTLYRTGDLARWRADGQLEYLGRADFQVKVRGFRIELGEIETVLERHPLIAQAVVTAIGQEGEGELVAYFVPRGQAPTVPELRSHLKEALPDYMVPTRYMALPGLPLTPNGKVDRKALPEPAPAAEAAPQPVAVPDGELERTIVAIWQQVLRTDRIGLTDNFFDLGGHSLKLVQVFSRLKQAVDCPLELTELFQCPTVTALANHLRAKQGTVVAPVAMAQPAPVVEAEGAAVGRTEIAIVGMAGRFPGANDVEAFWQLIANGLEGVTWFTREELIARGEDPAVLDHPAYVPVKGVLAYADRFDAAFFGVTPREAQTLDPQQRVFLETAWETLEHAGYDPDRYPGRIGLWAGAGFNGYVPFHLVPNRAFTESVSMYQIFIGNDKDFLTTRTAYKLNLTGPALTVQTACSTSLVAVHEACKSLRMGECDMALAGGVSVTLPLAEGYIYQEGHILSRDGACRAFSADSSGTVIGNGVGLVLLKRLEDARRDGDTIYAVIRGTAINNDGSLKVGYTAPSVEGQARVIREALKQADVPAQSVTYVEAHGTGTVLGDPIEVAGLTKAFREDGAEGTGFCAIGSVKTNVGHLDTAAGVAGLIKSVQALRYKQLPPSLHFESPNPKIDFGSSPFVVNTTLREWETGGKPRRAGVSSFGIGGTNAHAVLEEAPPEVPGSPSRPVQLLVLSARTPSALEQATDRLAAYLEANPTLAMADVAYTLQMGRRPMEFRRTVVATDTSTAVHALKERPGATGSAKGQMNVAFLFPGQGAQYPGMLAGLYKDEPIFREAFDRCAALLGIDLKRLVFEGAAEQLSQTAMTQPALFAIEYALAQLWLAWGVRPRAMMGHSLGEYVAAVLAGVMRLEDALRLVAARGRLIGSLPGGSMLAVPLPEAEVAPLLSANLSVAAVNGPAATVISGPTEAVDALAARLSARGFEGRRLQTSHAFHSAMLDPILEEFTTLVARVTLKPPVIPFVSNVTGTWITDEEAISPSYWAQQLRQAVRFAHGLATLFADPETALLEVGPGQTLSALARQHPGKGEGRLILASGRHPREQSDDLAVLLGALGQLWLAGAPVDWAGVWAGERRRRVALPTYPFERQRYWVEAPSYSAIAPGIEASAELPFVAMAVSTQQEEEFLAPEGELEQAVAHVWQEVLGIARVGAHHHFFELGGDSLIASRVVSRLRESFPVEVPLSAIYEAPTVTSLAARLEELLLEKLASLGDEEAEGLANG